MSFQVITEYVYDLLQSEEVGLKKLEIPLPEKHPSKVPFANQCLPYIGLFY